MNLSGQYKMYKQSPNSSSTVREQVKLKASNSKTSYYNQPRFFHEKSKRISLNEDAINTSFHNPKNSVSNLALNQTTRHNYTSDNLRKSSLAFLNDTAKSPRNINYDAQNNSSRNAEKKNMFIKTSKIDHNATLHHFDYKKNSFSGSVNTNQDPNILMRKTAISKQNLSKSASPHQAIRRENVLASSINNNKRHELDLSSRNHLSERRSPVIMKKLNDINSNEGIKALNSSLDNSFKETILKNFNNKNLEDNPYFSAQNEANNYSEKIAMHRTLHENDKNSLGHNTSGNYRTPHENDKNSIGHNTSGNYRTPHENDKNSIGNNTSGNFNMTPRPKNSSVTHTTEAQNSAKKNSQNINLSSFIENPSANKYISVRQVPDKIDQKNQNTLPDQINQNESQAYNLQFFDNSKENETNNTQIQTNSNKALQNKLISHQSKKMKSIVDVAERNVRISENVKASPRAMPSYLSNTITQPNLKLSNRYSNTVFERNSIPTLHQGQNSIDKSTKEPYKIVNSDNTNKMAITPVKLINDKEKKLTDEFLYNNTSNKTHEKTNVHPFTEKHDTVSPNNTLTEKTSKAIKEDLQLKVESFSYENKELKLNFDMSLLQEWLNKMEIENIQRKGDNTKLTNQIDSQNNYIQSLIIAQNDEKQEVKRLKDNASELKTKPDFNNYTPNEKNTDKDVKGNNQEKMILSSEKQFFVRKIETLERELEAEQDIVKQLNSNVSELVTTVNVLKAQVDSEQKNTVKFQQYNKELCQSLNVSNNELENLTNNKSGELNKIDVITQNFYDAKNQLDIEKSETNLLKQNNTKLLKQNNELKEKNDYTIQAIEELQNNVVNLHHEIHSHKEQNHTLKLQINEFDKDMFNLNQQNKELTHLTETLKFKNEVFSSKNDEIYNKNKELIEKLNTDKKNTDNFKASIEELIKANMNLKKELDIERKKPVYQNVNANTNIPSRFDVFEHVNNNFPEISRDKSKESEPPSFTVNLAPIQLQSELDRTYEKMNILKLENIEIKSKNEELVISNKEHSGLIHKLEQNTLYLTDSIKSYRTDLESQNVLLEKVQSERSHQKSQNVELKTELECEQIKNLEIIEKNRILKNKISELKIFNKSKKNSFEEEILKEQESKHNVNSNSNAKIKINSRNSVNTHEKLGNSKKIKLKENFNNVNSTINRTSLPQSTDRLSSSQHNDLLDYYNKRKENYDKFDENEDILNINMDSADSKYLKYKEHIFKTASDQKVENNYVDSVVYNSSLEGTDQNPYKIGNLSDNFVITACNLTQTPEQKFEKTISENLAIHEFSEEYKNSTPGMNHNSSTRIESQTSAQLKTKNSNPSNTLNKTVQNFDVEKIEEQDELECEPFLCDESYFYGQEDGLLIKLNVNQGLGLSSFMNTNQVSITTIAISNDKKYLFIGDQLGNLMQYLVSNLSQVYDYSQIFSSEISELLITKNNKYLFASGIFGELKQFDILNKIMLKDYGKIFGGEGSQLSLTHDNKYLFLAGKKHGEFKQFDIELREIVNHYGVPHKSGLKKILQFRDKNTNDCNFFTCSKNGEVFLWIKNEINNDNGYKMHSLGIILNDGIDAWIMTYNSKYLFLGNRDGFLAKLHVESAMITDFGHILNHGISTQNVSNCSTYLIISDLNGKFGMFSTENLDFYEKKTFDSNDKESFKETYIAQDGEYILGRSINDKIYLWSMKTLDQIECIENTNNKIISSCGWI